MELIDILKKPVQTKYFNILWNEIDQTPFIDFVIDVCKNAPLFVFYDPEEQMIPYLSHHQYLEQQLYYSKNRDSYDSDYHTYQYIREKFNSTKLESQHKKALLEYLLFINEEIQNHLKSSSVTLNSESIRMDIHFILDMTIVYLYKGINNEITDLEWNHLFSFPIEEYKGIVASTVKNELPFILKELRLFLKSNSEFLSRQTIMQAIPPHQFFVGAGGGSRYETSLSINDFEYSQFYINWSIDQKKILIWQIFILTATIDTHERNKRNRYDYIVISKPLFHLLDTLLDSILDEISNQFTAFEWENFVTSPHFKFGTKFERAWSSFLGMHVAYFKYLKQASQKNILTFSDIAMLPKLLIPNASYGERLWNQKVEAIIKSLQNQKWNSNDSLGAWVDQQCAQNSQWIDFFNAIYDFGSKSKASAKGLKSIESLALKQDSDQFKSLYLSGLEIISKCIHHLHFATKREYTLLNENVALCRGFIFLAPLFEHSELLHLFDEICVNSFKKIPGIGAACSMCANAIVNYYSELPIKTGAPRLLRLRQKFTTPAIVKTLDKALAHASKLHQMSPLQMAEIAIPTHDFILDQTRIWTFGEAHVSVKVNTDSELIIQWFNSDKPIKSIPETVKKNFIAELKKWKIELKEIQELLVSQGKRIESFYHFDIKWSWNDWYERYALHPMVAAATRSLIWTLEHNSVQTQILWINNNWVNLKNGESISLNLNDAQISLWHPILSPTQDTLNYRDILIHNKIKQIFKQAYREIYIVTDAEKATGHYSNRFASHIIKQYPFLALCKTREWDYSIQGQWDGHNIPYKKLDAEYEVSFVVDPVEESANENGIYMYLNTDRISFLKNGKQIQLEEIPILLFSETLRDLDLFVSVCSIGNDPYWRDGGPFGQEYWTSYSNHELLAESAKVRIDLLKKMIPLLKIAPYCEFDGKSLIVQGKKHRYHIHMGTGHIFIEGQKYLCIVPKSSYKDDKVFLPFEGDLLFSIILSKALLLADDDKIDDPSILSQL